MRAAGPPLLPALVLPALVLLAGPAALPGLRAQEETAPFPRAGEYAGTARCVECHPGQHRGLREGAHRAVLAAEALPGCETCHGPGRAHADSRENDVLRITMPPLLAQQGQTAFCGRCHQDQIGRHGGDMQGLQLAGKACTDCHAVHDRPLEVLPGVRFAARREASAAAEPTGSAACVECHPLRDSLLAASVHAGLAAGAREDGCETCHGHGSLHALTLGQARLITRADAALDGVETCRQCHQEVDPVRFHWRDREAPWLSAGVSCATCHRIHVAAEPVPAPEGPAPAPAPVPAEPGPPTNRTCAVCHVPALCTMPGSTHAALGAPDTPLAEGCGSCHAGGLAHAEASGRRDLVQRLGGAPADVQARACLVCHRGERTLLHVRQGSHFRSGVGCTECHGPLHGASPVTVAVDAEQHCARCHPAVAAEFRQPNRHPVPEGRMRCSSCHDVHGARPRVRDLELAERRCVGCHPRYRGPFVFAHQAGRREGCVVCHLPHGSSNRRLLQQADTQQNCLQCHGDFPSFHDQTMGAVFTDCIRCHTQVHGSNHSRYLLR